MGRKTFRKQIVTEETLKNINSDNKMLQDQFLEYKNLTASPTTIRGYSSDLDIFFSYLYLEQGNKFFVDLKKFDFIKAFSYFSEELQFGSARKNRMRSTLSSLSIFIESVMDDSFPDFKNLVLKAIPSAPKSPDREKTVLTDEEVEGIISHFEKEDLQIACWVALAAGSGARVSELMRIDMDTIENSKDVFNGIFLETPPIKSKGRGKNGKSYPKYIIKSIFSPIYEKWLKEREKILKEKGIEEDHRSIFLKQNGEAFTKSVLEGWNKKIEDFVGKPTYNHMFRHFTTSYMVRKGIPQNVIVSLINWASPSMLALYDDNTVTDMEIPELEALK